MVIFESTGRRSSSIGTLLALFWVSLAWTASADERHPFTVRDSVEMAYFGTLASSVPVDLDDDGVFSPDGRYFVKVTHRARFPEGLTEGTVWLFDTASILRSIRDPKLPVAEPEVLARLSAAVNSGLGIYALDAGNTITSPRWSRDGRTLMFLGRDGRANRQLFEVDLASRTLHPRTPASQDVLIYSESGDRVAYLVGPDADHQATRAWVSAGSGVPDISVGTSTPLMQLLYPYFKGNAYSEPLAAELWQVDSVGARAVLDSTGAVVKFVTRYTSLLISSSPDGNRVVTIAQAAGSTTQPEATGNDSSGSGLRYRIIDLRSGTLTDLEGVNVGNVAPGLYRAAWAPDGMQIALGGAQVHDGEKGLCGIALVRIDSSDARCVARVDQEQGFLMALDWRTDGETIHARYQADESHQSYVVLQHSGSRWRVDPRAERAARPRINLSVREALNDPPVLVATEVRTGRSRAIFDPNPQLEQIELGSAEVYRWKDAHGRENVGGLVLPADFVRGRRYPLVIQTHGFAPRRFFRAGYADTANAGRALAGRDILVLQVREPRPMGKPSWRDGIERGLDVYLAAVDQLVAEGLVDPEKVGISGYSYSGWLVANAITRAPKRFAAAEMANTDPATLTGYYQYVGTPVANEVAMAYVGARPYGSGLQTWLERAPSFATDKITAPVLFQPTDPWHLIGIWDMYAAMVDQGKPVELQYIRSGEHNIRKPLHILAHQGMLVDWFDFWLNGREDSAPGKVEQYQRWRKLRESHAAQHD